MWLKLVTYVEIVVEIESSRDFYISRYDHVTVTWPSNDFLG